MRGGFFHNQVLVEAPVRALQSLGATVHREYPVRRGRHPQFLDALAELDAYRIAVEGEQTLCRASNDVEKAIIVGADILLMVFPTGCLARAAYQKLATVEEAPAELKILVLSLGVVLEALRTKSRFMSALNVRQTLIHKIPPYPEAL